MTNILYKLNKNTSYQHNEEYLIFGTPGKSGHPVYSEIHLTRTWYNTDTYTSTCL